jgi:hypothetical protein
MRGKRARSLASFIVSPDCHSYCCKFTGLYYPTLACNFAGVPESPSTQLFPWLPRDQLSLPHVPLASEHPVSFPRPHGSPWTMQIHFSRVELIVSDSELALPPFFHVLYNIYISLEAD